MKLIDRTGRRYGRLTVLQRDTSRKGVYWLCVCTCGNEKSIRSGDLQQGKITSCGCVLREHLDNLPSRLVVGARYGRLMILRRPAPGNNFWPCLCDCGREIAVMAAKLRNGHTQSCGCYQRSRASAVNSTHGQSRTPAYARMKVRERMERKQQLDAAWTLEMEQALRESQPACVNCNSQRSLCTDHVKPLSKGHGLRPGNAVTLCRVCNSQKGAKDLSELPPEMAIKIAQAADEFNIFWGTDHE